MLTFQMVTGHGEKTYAGFARYRADQPIPIRTEPNTETWLVLALAEGEVGEIWVVQKNENVNGFLALADHYDSDRGINDMDVHAIRLDTADQRLDNLGGISG